MSGSAQTGAATITTRADLGDDEAGKWAYYSGQGQIMEKAEEAWRLRAWQVVRRYRDDRKDIANAATATVHRFNILWSNVQTLAPVLYARTPKAVVQRRYLDKDPVGRLASQILERAIDYTLESHDFDNTMNPVVQDRLLPGRGVARIMYVPTFGDPIRDEAEAEFDDADDQAALVSNPGDAEPDDPMPGAATPSNPLDRGADPDAEPEREVLSERFITRYVPWADYAELPARQWEEMELIRFRSYMTRTELKARFKAKGAKVKLDYTPPGSEPKGDDKGPPPDLFKKAKVDEYWDKTKRRVVWIAPGTPDLVLDDVEDPLGLPDFFPVPQPLLATTTTDTRIPVPDYTEYQDQADELDTLTARIDKLTQGLKMVGFYAGSEKATIQQLMDPGMENRLVPVEDWASISGKEGLKGAIQWLPMGEIAQVLIQLCDMRDRSKAIIYEITGVGDIIRGATQPTETATAQKLKASFATRRMEPYQKQVARFARDMIRLLAGGIAEHFSAETLSEITGFPELEPVPELPPAPAAMIPAPMGTGQPQAMGAVA